MVSGTTMKRSCLSFGKCPSQDEYGTILKLLQIIRKMFLLHHDFHVKHTFPMWFTPLLFNVPF